MSSTTSAEQPITSYRDAPTRSISAAGVNFAYRELGPKSEVPMVFLVHRPLIPLSRAMPGT